MLRNIISLIARSLKVLLLSGFTNSVLAQEIVLEAEAGYLVNGASVVNSTLCSGGRKVGNIGDPARNGGIRLTFDAPSGGDYMCNLYYLSGENRNLNLIINNSDSILLSCNSTGGWDTPKILTTAISLKQGENMLLLDNNAGYGPDIDMIIIAPVDNNHADTTGMLTKVVGKWKFNMFPSNGTVDIYFNNKMLMPESCFAFNDSGKIYYSHLTAWDTLETGNFTDDAGSGQFIKIRSHIENGGIDILRNFYVYPETDFLLTDIEIESEELLASNYMAPVYSVAASEYLSPGQNKLLAVPFDNDKWIRYQALDFGIPLISYEVISLFNTVDRQGIIIGSVKHDTWKTGIRSSTHENQIDRLEVFGGVSSFETRDILPHGTVRAKRITSPKIMIGVFSDWRRGLETYADVNENYAPRLPWYSGKPFVWNSWGAIQDKITYTKASEVSIFISENLQNNNFQNDSTMYINLDSYWDRISYTDLIKFVKECKGRGQKAGIYWTPFVDWAHDPNRVVEGTNGAYRYGDIYLYANGNTQDIAGGIAIDPTHPATKMRANLFLKRFIDQGFQYLKLDFMSHGALEADKFYDTTVFTGIQAYNQGMQYIVNYLAGRMYINLSIAPLFPSQYAHGRRIACDAYGSMNDTEYTLNSLTYGWWLDRLYTYNDADNVVLSGFNTGENRARVTSSVITGIFCAGDDFSSSGTSTAKARAKTFLTNDEVNKVARIAKAFSPADAATGGKATDQFTYKAGDTTYVAIFNFNLSAQEKTIRFEKVGLTPGKTYVAHELWTDTKTEVNGDFSVTIPLRDARLYKIFEGTITGTKDYKADSRDFFLYPNPCNDELKVPVELTTGSTAMIYDLAGQKVKAFNPVSNVCYVGDLRSGVYIFSIQDKTGRLMYSNFVKN